MIRIDVRKWYHFDPVSAFLKSSSGTWIYLSCARHPDWFYRQWIQDRPHSPDSDSWTSATLKTGPAGLLFSEKP